MALLMKPLWDPTGAVSVAVDEARGRVAVSAEGELVRFELREQRAERLGWVRLPADERRGRARRVSVGEVVCHCLREWEAEQRVLALSQAAGRRALRRGGRWEAPGRRLAEQTRAARAQRRISTLPFRVLYEHRARPALAAPLTSAVAAQRIGYLMADGRPDTERLRRRLGIAGQRDGRRGGARRQRSVGYATGVALCRAVEVDPVELGL